MRRLVLYVSAALVTVSTAHAGDGTLRFADGPLPTSFPKPLVFEHVEIVGVVHKPLVEFLPVRQDVTTEATVPVRTAPLLPKVEQALTAL